MQSYIKYCFIYYLLLGIFSLSSEFNSIVNFFKYTTFNLSYYGLLFYILNIIFQIIIPLCFFVISAFNLLNLINRFFFLRIAVLVRIVGSLFQMIVFMGTLMFYRIDFVGGHSYSTVNFKTIFFLVIDIFFYIILVKSQEGTSQFEKSGKNFEKS